MHINPLCSWVMFSLLLVFTLVPLRVRPVVAFLVGVNMEDWPSAS